VCRAVGVLPEGRQAVAPGLATIEGVVEPAVVVANARVILPGNQVVRVGRVERDALLRLAPEGAVLVDADVAIGISLAAAERA